MTLWIGSCAVLKVPVHGNEKNFENNSWMELFNFENSFNCH